LIADLRGKTAVVTGAGSGIGRGMAQALAGAGVARLGLLDIDQNLLDAARAEFAGGGITVAAHQLDVSDRAAVQRAAAAFEAELGIVHVLCDNAGVAFRGPSIEDTPDETFDWLFNVNVFGIYNVIKAFVPAMKAHGQGGHLVITASNTGLHLIPGRRNGVYGATKMAVVGIAESLQETLEPEGIGVSVLCPGMVKTNAQHSGRWRPQRFGGPFEREGASAARPGMDPADVGRIVVRAITDGTFYIFPHPLDREFVEERFAAISADFDRWERVLPELGVDPKQQVI
jgi:NAD(P)-dependent dehydrogenase (short-subunit alcohol dehydrogenase family)